MLLWSAILPLCEAAGTRGAIDERSSADLLDPILFGAPGEVEALFGGITWDRRQLIAQGADIELLERGRVIAALRSATERSDWSLVQTYDAERDRVRRGVELTPLDAALLTYTGRYLYGGKVPAREPDAVDPALLPEVLQVIAVAEQAYAAMPPSPGSADGAKRLDLVGDWQWIEATVDRAVRRAYPQLVDDAVRTVSFLICSEATSRA